MGLDITAHGGPLTRLHDACLDNCEGFGVYVNADFPAHAEGIEAGCYTAPPPAVSFRAGSYSGYNEWRRWLAGLFNATPEAIWHAPIPPLGPFVELINFSDCEGIIGPQTSAKLQRDFAAHRDLAEHVAAARVDGSYLLRVYGDFNKAFALAAEGGVVVFH